MIVHAVRQPDDEHVKPAEQANAPSPVRSSTSMQAAADPAGPSRGSATAVSTGLAEPFAGEMLVSAARASGAAETMTALRADPAECGQFFGERTAGQPHFSVRLGPFTFPPCATRRVAFGTTAMLDGAGASAGTRTS
jgi:hypothetical protein